MLAHVDSGCLYTWTSEQFKTTSESVHEWPTKQASSYRPRVWGDKWNPETWQEPHRKGFSLKQTKQYAIAQTGVCRAQWLTETTQAQLCPEGTEKQKKDVSSARSASLIVELSSLTSLKLLSCWSRRSGDQTCASRNPPRARAWYKEKLCLARNWRFSAGRQKNRIIYSVEFSTSEMLH